MALIRTITLDTGITVENAYFKVGPYEGDRPETNFIMNCYLDKATSKTKKPLQQKVYKFTPSTESGSENIIKQCYMHAKTTEDFIDAEDDLDF